LPKDLLNWRHCVEPQVVQHLGDAFDAWVKTSRGKSNGCGLAGGSQGRRYGGPRRARLPLPPSGWLCPLSGNFVSFRPGWPDGPEREDGTKIHFASLFAITYPNNVLIPRLHDTTCCQTSLTTGLTTGCIVSTGLND